MGGTKYKIKMLAYHSVHNEHQESKESFAKLKWRSDKFFEQPVPKEKLYRTNNQPPIKIGDYFKDDFVLASMRNYANAFINSETYKMDDIPLQF